VSSSSGAVAAARYHGLIEDLEDRHWWFVATRELIVDLLGRHVAAGGRVLDAGCGSGRLLQAIPTSYERTGLDLDVESARSRPGLELASGSIERIPFPDAAFDAVVAIDVISARGVDDDGLALRELRRVLKPGGVAIIQVAAYPWLRSGHDVPSGTARRYTAGRLRRLLMANGFRPTRVGYRVTLAFPAAVIRRLLIRNRAKDDLADVPALVNGILLSITRLENRIVSRMRLPFGLSVMAVATAEDAN
jgi:SAM-dependent methyltransferase